MLPLPMLKVGYLSCLQMTTKKFELKRCSKYYLQSILGCRTSRSSNNSVFERKIRDENRSVLEQKFGSHTTQEKDLPEPKRQRIEETSFKLSEVFMDGDFPSKKQLISFFP